MTVVEHRAVHYAWMILSEVLQVLVVGGDHAKGLFLPELFQHRLCNGASDGRLRSTTELINKQQTLGIRLLHHLFHIHQVA